MSTELRRALDEVAARRRSVRVRVALALAWVALAVVAVGLGLALGRPGTERHAPGIILVWLGALVGVGFAIALPILRAPVDPRQVAGEVEAKFPDLGTGLLAAIDEDVASPDAPRSYLQSAVIRQVLAHHRRHDWTEAVVPTARLRFAGLAYFASLILLAVATLTMFFQAARHNQVAERLLAENPGLVAGEAPQIQVEPGSVEVERGAPLLVVARFAGGVPADASLVTEDGSGSSTAKAMSRALEDPTFAGRIESVGTDLTYRVRFPRGESEAFKIKVFDYPEVRRADAKLDFPSYTGMETKIVEDIRHVTAVEGTNLTLTFHLNKAVVEAKLVDEKGEATPLAKLDGKDTPLYASSFTLVDPHRYKVELVDQDGRKSKVPAEVAVNVTRNRPATVAMTQPSRDVRVSPVEELTLKALVDDDFGVTRHGLAYSVAGEEPKEVELAGPKPSGKKIKAEHLLAFEAMKARPDQLVTYYFWAEDIGPDGQPRRTMGDMFFAEVRHFDEIFRQGEQQSASEEQPPPQNGAAQQAEKLAELQKQIINATWKLVRRETRSQPTAEFAADAKTLRESQEAAIEQAEGLAGELRDETSKDGLAKAIGAMKDAVKRLTSAETTPSIKELPPALTAEQSAYQTLLKLRARETEVTRQRSRSSSSSSASQQQRQQELDQLELKDDENRFEQQTSAKARTEQQQQQQEDRQVANRLKELAQRQADLNTRLKELQSALEAAKDQAAREEIERQLKRLREQQQQMLRDTDELQQRMESEPNRERLAQERQQVEQARENVRQASEALEEGRLSQAVNEGARAKDKMDQVRDDLRKKSSDRFAQDMTEMREQARKLDETQTQLADQLDAKDKQAQRALRDSDARQQALEGLKGQETQLDGLLDRMRDTVQQAEETEPLLAKQLYEAVNKANQQAIPEALKQAEQLAEVGINDEAAKSARQAGQGIGQLREGVEKAASSVLGDETAALKRAQSELEDLSKQVDRELARNDPANPSGQQPRGQGQPQPGEQASQQPGTEAGQQPGEQPGTEAGQQPGQQPGRQRGQQGQQGQGQQGQGQQSQQGQQGQGQQGQGQQGQGQQNQGQQGQGQQGQGQQNQGQQGQGQQGQGQQGQGQQGQGQQGQGQQGQGQQGQGQGQQGQGQGQQGQGQQGQGQQGQGQGQGGQGGNRQGGMRQAGSTNGGGNTEGAEGLLEGMGQEITARAPVPSGPITGDGFRQWSDRMRDVEELLQDPQLRAEAARIRDRARGAREEYKRHATEPDPKALKEMVADPIRELRDRVAEEVRRRESPDSLVPIDRDPVPTRFTEGVRRYYERLGSGR